jgi:sarcosine oxidase, subunit delta
MGFLLRCPNCGRRDNREFWFGGEDRSAPKNPEEESADSNFERVWFRDNQRGLQVERWFHFAGCRRWHTVERDTHSNVVRQAGLVREPGGDEGIEGREGRCER